MIAIETVNQTIPDHTPERAVVPYRMWAEAEFQRLNFDYLHYDEKGELWIGEWNLMEVIETFGGPLEITDTTLITHRCQQLSTLVNEIGSTIGYDPDNLEFYYAAKANMAAEVTTAAYQTGWGAETSGVQDLVHLHWLANNNLIDPNIPIICNGFKLDPNCFNLPDGKKVNRRSQQVIIESNRHEVQRTNEVMYAEYILLLHDMGYRITPILDSGEFEYFNTHTNKPMNVGLRYKHGKVAQEAAHNQLVSRHGMNWEELSQTAILINQSNNLNLTTFHAMVGAAETMPVDQFVENLLFACDKFFQLRETHSSLEYFNMGGGLPPMTEAYNHGEFFTKLLNGIKAMADAYGQPLPKLMFEYGSFVASESGLQAFKVLQLKQNSVDDHGNPETWAIIGANLMEAIPDMLIIDGKEFNVFAANHADLPMLAVRLGDLTCDSDGRYPPKILDKKRVNIPNSLDTYIVLIGVGAYQRQLSGEGGVKHCGLPESAKAVVYKGSDDLIHIYTAESRQIPTDQQSLLSYDQNNLPHLQKMARVIK